MKNLRLSETINTTLSIFCSALATVLVPTIIELTELALGEIWEILLRCGVAILIFPVLHHFLPRFVPCLRPLRGYEGYWLQIIPGFIRPFSIISFKYSYKQKGYYLSGTNCSEDFKKRIHFDADKFVETNHRDGFYYITNTTSEYKNGLGKISFLNSHYDCLTRARGYFFDASSETCSNKYETFFVKCDKNFFRRLKQEYKYIRIRKLSAAEIISMSEQFLSDELERCMANFLKNEDDAEKNLFSIDGITTYTICKKCQKKCTNRSRC